MTAFEFIITIWYVIPLVLGMTTLSIMILFKKGVWIYIHTVSDLLIEIIQLFIPIINIVRSLLMVVEFCRLINHLIMDNDNKISRFLNKRI